MKIRNPDHLLMGYLLTITVGQTSQPELAFHNILWLIIDHLLYITLLAVDTARARFRINVLCIRQDVVVYYIIVWHKMIKVKVWEMVS